MEEIATKITASELEIMRVLWEAAEPMTITGLKGVLLETTKWNGDTIKTLLRRLCDKGAVAAEKREVYYYRPVVSAEEYGRYSTQHIIDKLYRGSARDMIAALVRNDQLRAEDIDELRAMLQAGDEL